MEQSTRSTNRPLKRDHVDPDPVLLVLNLVAGLGGIGGLVVAGQKVHQRRVLRQAQKASRKKVKEELQRLWSDLQEWSNALASVKSFYQHAAQKGFEAELRLGGSPLKLSAPEFTRFQQLTDRLQRLQKRTSKRCAVLGTYLDAIEACDTSDVGSVSDFRRHLVEIVAKFNNELFARTASPGSPKTMSRFRSHDAALSAIERLINETRLALNNLEKMLGSEYDR